jgi:hypothetical protein
MIKVEEFIPEIFLRLTSKTYPHGYEDVIADEMIRTELFPRGIEKDVHGNYFYKIGESRSIFASHLDTVSRTHTQVNHVLNGDMISTDGTTTLGADDKAGVSILIWMMKHNIPGLYYFFIGEEVGCIGSGLAASYGNFSDYDRIISFDRRGTGSIITHQSYSRCCSDAFGDALCDQLNKSGMSYTKDDGGVYTDSAEFVDYIPECTNVSVGYYNEHSTNEKQDISHLIDLCVACLSVDWESLPVVRDPKIYERKSTTYSWSKYKSDDNAHSRDYAYYKDWGNTDFDDDFEDDRAQNTTKGKSWTRAGLGAYEETIVNDNKILAKRGKRSRGKNKNNGKVYLAAGSELIELGSQFENVKIPEDNEIYHWIMEKFNINSNRLTQNELEIIKEQYLDIENDPYDKYFYDTLENEIFDMC